MLQSLHHSGEVANKTPLVSCYTYCGGFRWHWYQRSSSLPGQPVVLIHGLVSSSTTLVPLATMLAGWAPVFLPDLPGCGQTKDTISPLTVPEMAGALADWMRLSVTGPAHILGDSFGCQVAVELAIHWPQFVRSLTLLGPTLDPTARDISSQVVRLLRDLPQEPIELWVDQAYGYARMGLKYAVGTLKAMMQDRMESKLPLVPVPTLVLRGKVDPIAPEAWAQRVAKLVPEGSAISLPYGAHYVHYTHPGLVASAMRKFTLPMRVEKAVTPMPEPGPVPKSPASP